MKTQIISGCMAVVCAHAAEASFVGGAFVTDASWNAAASAAIGQEVTVYRLFFAFDDPLDTMLNVYGTRFGAAGRTLYQEPISNSSIPPSEGLFSILPEAEWDSFVSIGALRLPSTTAVGPQFEWPHSGGDGLSQSELTGGWQTSDPFVVEGRSIAPGGVDVNGDTPVPASFSAAYTYTFLGQFTLLGSSDLADYAPVLDGGFIYSDVFSGKISMTFYDGPQAGGIEQIYDIPIGVPAPGGVSALLVTVGAFATRRRRSVRHPSPA